jgi:hypothetical protein
MIGCDVCDEWFHLDCVGLTLNEAQSIDRYVCPLCKHRKSILTPHPPSSALLCPHPLPLHAPLNTEPTPFSYCLKTSERSYL